MRGWVAGCGSGVGLVAAGSATFGRGLASHATILVHCGLWRQPLPGTNVNRKRGKQLCKDLVRAEQVCQCVRVGCEICGLIASGVGLRGRSRQTPGNFLVGLPLQC